MARESVPRQPLRDGSRMREIVSGRRNGAGRYWSAETRPRSTYEAVTRQMVKSLTDEVQDVKQRVNQLFTLIVGAILLEVFMRLIGVGV